jgi:hypothetical protein
MTEKQRKPPYRTTHFIAKIRTREVPNTRQNCDIQSPSDGTKWPYAGIFSQPFKLLQRGWARGARNKERMRRAPPRSRLRYRSYTHRFRPRTLLLISIIRRKVNMWSNCLLMSSRHAISELYSPVQALRTKADRSRAGMPGEGWRHALRQREGEREIHPRQKFDTTIHSEKNDFPHNRFILQTLEGGTGKMPFPWSEEDDDVNFQQLYVFAMNNKASPPSTNTFKKWRDLFPCFSRLESRLAGEYTAIKLYRYSNSERSCGGCRRPAVPGATYAVLADLKGY